MTNDVIWVVLRVVGFERVGADFVGKVLPLPPSCEGVPVLGPDIEGEDALLFVASLDSAKAGPTGRVLVLRVGFMVGKVLIDDGAAFFPLGFVGGVHLDPGVNGFAARVHQKADWKVRLLEYRKLLLLGFLVELDQHMAVRGHGVVRTRVVVLGKGIDANPRPLLGLGKVLALLGTRAEELGQPLGARDASGRR